MSTPTQSNSGGSGKRKPLIQQSPLQSFQKLTQRSEPTGIEVLKEARQIDLNLIDTNPRQPRRSFDEASLQELANDIAARGVLQPPIVRPLDNGRYEIVVGERRFRAAKLAGQTSIPALVRDLDDQEAEVTSLIENIQRENLSLGDEVSYFQMLKSKYGYSVREIADEIAHKSHSYVDVRLKLAENPEVLGLVEKDQLGLQKANLLMRLDPVERAQEIRKVQKSLENSQSVFSKDTTLQTSQSERQKTNGSESARAATQLARPFVVISREIEKIASRFQQAQGEEKAAILESIEHLEREITSLKKQLKHK